MENAMVLVVDDDQRMLHLINLVLEIEGYRVVTSTRGGEALEIVINQNPDLILLDVMLPDTDGYSLCQRIREFSQTPIIMVSARGTEDDRVHGLVIGAEDYITKPFSSRELVARVKVALRCYSSQYYHLCIP